MRRGWLWMIGLLAACGEAGTAPGEPRPAPSGPPRLAQVSADREVHGARLAKVLGCTGCHGDDLTGNDWSEPELGTFWSANLTRSGERWSEAELTQMIVAGRRPDRPLMEMPSVLFSRLHPDDVAALVAWMKSLDPDGPVRPEPAIKPEPARQIASGEYPDSARLVEDYAGKAPPDAGPDHALGRQIVTVTCVECHGFALRGRASSGPDDAARPDLRMVASYSPDDFRRLMRDGKAAGDREVGLMSTVARRRYANFTDGEITAVHAYLTELAARDP